MFVTGLNVLLLIQPGSRAPIKLQLTETEKKKNYNKHKNQLPSYLKKKNIFLAATVALSIIRLQLAVSIQRRAECTTTAKVVPAAGVKTSLHHQPGCAARVGGQRGQSRQSTQDVFQPGGGAVPDHPTPHHHPHPQDQSQPQPN